MRIVISCFFIAIICLSTSCRKQDVSGDEYVAYVENKANDLLKIKEIDDLSFQMQYCPAEYLLLKEMKTDNISAEMMRQRKAENDSMVFFKLRISAKATADIIGYNIHSQEDYYNRAQYLSYGLEEDIALVKGKDTLFPAIFHYERTYGIAPYADFMLAFNTKENDEFQVIIDDKVFNTGVLKFTYADKDIQNIPQLKTN